MRNMAIKLLEWLTADIDISIIVTIPKWGKYSKFECYDKLINSPYVSYHVIIPKICAKFYNYINGKIITPCSIHLILLQNKSAQYKYPHMASDLHNIKIKYFKK
jgi:hypothetical protein